MLNYTSILPSYGWFGDVNGKMHEFLFGRDCIVAKSPPITSKTINLGESHSPEYICFPAKAVVGLVLETYDIHPYEALVFINQAPGVLCRVQSYMHVLQEVVDNLGLPIRCFQVNALTKLQGFRRIGEEFKLSPAEVSHMMAFLWESGAFLPKLVEAAHNLYVSTYPEYKAEVRRIEKEIRDSYRHDVHTLDELLSLETRAKQELQKIPVDDSREFLKVSIMGEFAVVVADELNSHLRAKLASLDVLISDFSMTTFLGSYASVPLRHVARQVKTYRSYAQDWYPYNTNGETDINVGKMAYHAAKRDVDGVFHLRPFGCLAETNVVNILYRISEEQDMPVISLSFDSNTNSEHTDTRIEAFITMLEEKKRNGKCTK